MNEKPSSDARLERENSLLSALLDTTLELARRSSSDGLLDTILRKAAALVGVTEGFIGITDRRTGETEMRIGLGVFAGADIRLAKGEGLAGLVLRSGEPQVISDYDHWEGRSDQMPPGQIHTVAMVPLRQNGDVIGVLAVASAEARVLDDEAVLVLRRFGELASVALVNAELLDSERSGRQQALTLLAASEAVSRSLDLDEVLARILTELRRVVPYDSASIQEMRGGMLEIIAGYDLEKVERFVGVKFDPSNAGIPNGLVVRQRAPVIVNETREFSGFESAAEDAHQIRSWLGVPLIVGDRLIGIISLDKKEPGFYEPRHSRLANAFASHAAIALENARLFEAANRELNERRKVEQRLRDAEAGYRKLVEQLPAIVYRWSINADGSGTSYISPQVETLLGYTPDEWMADADLWWKVIHPEDRDRVVDALAAKDRTGGSINILHRLVSRDGRTLWFQNRSETEFDEQGKPTNTHGLMLDISEAKRAEETLRRMNDELVSLFEDVARARRQAEERAEGLAALNRVAAALTSVLDLDTMLQLVSRELVELFHARSCGITLLTEDRSGLRVVAEHSTDPTISALGALLPLEGNDSTAKVLREGRGMIVRSAKTSPLTESLHDMLRARRTESLIIAPLVVRGEVIGTIGLDTDKSDREFTDAELTLAETVARQAANAMENARLFEQMQKARDAAAAASQAKSVFLANMSHEIRTPMNAVIGMTGLLLDTELTAEQHEFAETIRSSGDALLTIINDILDFSKIEAGRLEIENQPFEVNECIESALDLFATPAAQKGLDLSYFAEDDVPERLMGDVTRLRQIIVNLLSNAIKFTDHGEIEVRAEATFPERGECELHVSVRDTGVGIPAGLTAKLFQPFSQVDASTTRRFGGTGLGLAISSRFAEMMGGRLWVESEAGKGSTFHCTIRAAVASAQRSHLRGVQKELAGKRVLIVDDNATNRRILVLRTRMWGMVPADTGDPATAIEWVERGDPFDIGILDMQMPGMDGFTLGNALRRSRSREQLPLVLLTSLGRRDEDMPEFAAFLTKPVKPTQLHQVLTAVTSGRKVITDARVAHRTFDPEFGRRHPLRILVAEDNVVNQRLILLTLEHMGYRADVAANGWEVLQALRRQPYDVVLMDVQMPELDGLEATRRIRRQFPAGTGPRIIAMTANAMREDREICLEAGMDDYLSKPLQASELMAALEATPRGSASDSTSTEPPALDPEALDALRSLQRKGRKSILLALLDTFRTTTPEMIASVRKAFADGDPAGVAFGAHSIRGAALNLGARRLSEITEDLERIGKRGSLEGVAELLDDLEHEFTRVCDAAELEKRKVKGG